MEFRPICRGERNISLVNIVKLAKALVWPGALLEDS